MSNLWRTPLSGMDQRMVRAVYGRTRSKWKRKLLEFVGIDIPPEVPIGEGLRLRHATNGVVIHPRTTIGSNVTIYQNVTLGRGDIWQEHGPDWRGFVIEDEAILCAGAVVASPGHRSEPIVVAEGSVVGANAVLTQSTGPWEVWVGSPARKVGERPQPSSAASTASSRVGNRPTSD